MWNFRFAFEDQNIVYFVPRYDSPLQHDGQHYFIEYYLHQYINAANALWPVTRAKSHSGIKRQVPHGQGVASILIKKKLFWQGCIQWQKYMHNAFSYWVISCKYVFKKEHVTVLSRKQVAFQIAVNSLTFLTRLLWKEYGSHDRKLLSLTCFANDNFLAWLLSGWQLCLWPIAIMLEGLRANTRYINIKKLQTVGNHYVLR